MRPLRAGGRGAAYDPDEERAMAIACHVETAPSGLRIRAADAGFGDMDREGLERLAASALEGVIDGPRLLSYGGLWVTFVARDTWDGTRTFVGIRRREGLDRRATEEVLGAARASRDIDHPVVLPLRRVGRTSELLWLAAREYRGRLLDHWYDSGTRHPPSGVMELIGLVSGPLEALHESGLAHGALTASSFHRDVAGTIRICNLGVDLALLRAEQKAGHAPESLSLAAPEVRGGREPLASSDQYSIAALAVRLLAGRAPEPDDDLSDERVPTELRAALRRALASDPRKRFASMSAFQSALEGGHADGDLEEEDYAPEPYVPSAFRPRRSERARPFAAPTPEVLLDEVLADDEAWDQERWDLGAAPPRRRSGRRELMAALVLVVISGSLALFYGEGAYTFPIGRSDRGPTAGPTATVEAPATVPAGEPTDGTQAPPTSGAEAEPSEVPTPEGVAAEPSVPDPGSPTSASESPASQAAPEPPTSPSEPRALQAAPDPASPDPRSEPAAEVTSGGAAAREPPAAAPEPAAVASEPRASEPASEPAPPPVVDPPLAPGTISIQSYPWGEVYLDGVYVGTTPLLDLRITAGVHTLRIERTGYQPYVRAVDLAPGQTLRFTGIVLRGGGG